MRPLVLGSRLNSRTTTVCAFTLCIFESPIVRTAAYTEETCFLLKQKKTVEETPMYKYLDDNNILCAVDVFLTTVGYMGLEYRK